MTFEYKPSGVCSRKYTFEMEGDVIKGCKIEGGCAGNLLGISKIITGMKAEDVIKAFEGTNETNFLPRSDFQSFKIIS